MNSQQKKCSHCGNSEVFKLNRGNTTFFPAFVAVIAVSTIVIILTISFKLDRENYSVSDLASAFSQNFTKKADPIEETNYDSSENETNPFPPYSEPEEMTEESTTAYETPEVEPAIETATPLFTENVNPPEEVEIASDDVDEEPYNNDYEYYSELGISVENFMMQFRQSYSIALNNNDFSYVEPFLSFDSEAYHEIKDYMNDISGYGYTFDFEENRLIQMSNVYDDMYAETYEEFSFTDNVGKTTKYERYKTYKLLANESGDWSITNINITDTSKY